MNKLFIGMMACAAMGFCSAALTSCSNDDEQPVAAKPSETFAKNYFEVENGTFVEGSVPSSTEGEPISGVSINSQALTGGMNFITIQSETEYDMFMVGVKGHNGYWEVPARNNDNLARSAYFTYMIPMNFGVGFDDSFTLQLSAKDVFGNLTPAIEKDIEYVESLWGDLNINLTFSNAKDVDLHLYTPAGEHIYFGNRGAYITDSLSGENTQLWGLDHDSNAACYIDSLNNENIMISSDMVLPGIYTVRVNMWSNCDPTIATNWAIVARYKDRIITPLEGNNPASGVYEEYAPAGDNTFVMSFRLKEEAQPTDSVRHQAPRMFKPIPLTDTDLMKLSSEGI